MQQMTDVYVKKQILTYIGYKAKIASDIEELDLFQTSYVVNKNSVHRFSMEFSLASTRNCLMISQMSKSMIESSFDSDSFNLNDVFVQLFESNREKDLVRVHKNEKEVNLKLLKSFWFSCCVMFQVFYNVLLAPIHKKEWVNCMDFLRSIEATYQKNVLRSFMSEEKIKKFSESMRIQQFLCMMYLVYFCIVEFNYGGMNLHGLISVLRLTRRMGKNTEDDLMKIAKNIFEIANKKRSEVKELITLREFYSVLLNKL